jgi:hypothetical protein
MPQMNSLYTPAQSSNQQCKVTLSAGGVLMRQATPLQHNVVPRDIRSTH